MLKVDHIVFAYYYFLEQDSSLVKSKKKLNSSLKIYDANYSLSLWGFYQTCVFISFLPSLEIMRRYIIRISLQYNIKKKYQNFYLKTARLYFYYLLCDFILHCYEQVTTEIFKRC